MQKISVFIFTIIIRFCFCCNDDNNISFLPPFNDVDTIRLSVGDDVVFVCCHPDGANKLRWENPNGKEIPLKSTDPIMNFRDEKNRLILRIDNIDKNNVGTYTCRHVTRNIAKQMTINVKPPSLAPKTEKIEKIVPKRDSFTIECSLKDKQIFKNWVYTEGGKNFNKNEPGRWNNFAISNDKLSFTVFIKNNNVPFKMIWCQYQEVTGDGDVSMGLYEYSWILYDPINPKITLEAKQPIIEGQNVNLTCHFTVSEAQVVVFPTEHKQSINVINEEKKGRVILELSKITKNMEGEYQCRVTKFLNTITFKVAEENASIKIDVLIPPKISLNEMNVTTDIGEDVCLKCEVTDRQLEEKDIKFERFLSESQTWAMLSGQTARYSFQFTERKSVNRYTLCIKDVQWDDRGQYKCSATNAAGKDSVIKLLKVKKSPDLKTEQDLVHIGMTPVQVDCSVYGYPVNDSADTVELRVVNTSHPFNIKKPDRRFNELDGLRLIYEVALDRKLTSGEVYHLECFYHNVKNQQKQTKIIKLRVSDSPDPPKVSVWCTGSSGVVFRYEKPKVTQTTKDVKMNKLFYAPSKEYELLPIKPSENIRINYDDYSEDYFFYTLTNLLPATDYSFKWESYNSFQISNFKNMNSKTEPLSKPKSPKSLEFSTKWNKITVNVTWDDECSYVGVNSAIKDIVVKMKSLNIGNENNWQWIESNFTLEMSTKSLQFFISLEKPQVDYEIEVVLRNTQGSSDMIKAVYKADVVLAGSLYSCFPRCSGQKLYSSILGFQSVLISILVLLLMKNENFS